MILKPPYDVLYIADPKDVKRFMDKVIVGEKSDCWYWVAAIDKDGYGTFQVANGKRGEKQRAHVVSYAMYTGIWPTKQVLHKCHVECCVYPLHLYEGTQHQNIQDQIVRGTFVRGSLSGLAILDETKVGIIKQKLRNGVQGIKIAREFEMSASTISAIKTGRLWSHVS